MPGRRRLAHLLAYGIVAALAIIFALALGGVGGAPWRFASRGALLLLVACALLCWVGFHLHASRAATFSFSQVGDLGRARPGVVAWLAPLPRALRVVAVGLVAVALARPQTIRREAVELEGIDIMIVLDLSKSMEERDLRRNRLEAAQRTINRFLEGRQHDRIGLVVFAREAMLQCPLTTDYGVIETIVSDLAIGDLEPMGTAIGDGVGLALATLRRSEAKSKVVILLTDGDSNVTTYLGPDEAMEVARGRAIPVFTVLMGKEAGKDASPLDPFGRRAYGVNPTLLRDMAKVTGGRYFNAEDTQALQRGFDQVRATLQKTKRREVRKIPTELYPRLVAAALGLLLVEVLLSLTRWRKFP